MTTQVRQGIYGALAVAGFIGTAYFNTQYFQQTPNPVSLAFFEAGFASPAASSITIDLFVTCLAFFVFLFVEGRRLGMRNLWIYVLFSLGGALAVMFPVFLLMRERALHPE